MEPAFAKRALKFKINSRYYSFQAPKPISIDYDDWIRADL
jgi:hypothetical protein